MELILATLEWLSKYGFIDIILSLGIFAYISKILKGRVKSNIDGIDLLPYISVEDKILHLSIKNQSSQPLYLYQAYVKPGYYTEQIDRSTFYSIIRTLFLKTWKNDTFPKMNRPKTTNGLYVLQVPDLNDNTSPTLFINPYSYKDYILDFEEISPIYSDNPNKIFDDKKFGLLILQFVHGTNSGKLQLQI